MRNATRALVTFITLAMASTHAMAASPREELLALLPKEPAFCVAVQDLRGQSKRLLESPFGQRFQQSPLFAGLMSAEPIARLREMDEQLKMHLQTSIAEIRDEAFGDAFVLAFWPADGATPETALILTQARNKDLPAAVLKRLNDLQLQSGDLQRADVVQHGAATYNRCTEAGGKVNCQLVLDGLVALTSDEELLKQVIDRRTQRDRKLNNRLAQSFVDLGVAKDAAVVWVNPRAFDRQMAEKLANANASELPVLRLIQNGWHQTSGLALSANLGEVGDVRLSVQMATESLSPTLQKILKEARTSSALWSRIPDDAIVAAAGRFDLAEIAQLLNELAPADQQGKQLADVNKTTMALLGMDVHKDILEKLGPDWCFYVAAPPSARVMPDVVLGMALRNHNAEVEEAFGDSLRTLGGLLAMGRANEGKPTMLKRSRLGDVRVTSIWSEAWAEAGLQPAGAIKEGCLVLASSPDAIGRFPQTKPPIAKDGPVPLLKVSFTRAVAFLNDPQRRPALINLLGEMHQQPAAEIDERLQQLTNAFDLFDGMELVQETSPGRLILRLRLKTKEALTLSGKSN